MGKYQGANSFMGGMMGGAMLMNDILDRKEARKDREEQRQDREQMRGIRANQETRAQESFDMQKAAAEENMTKADVAKAAAMIETGQYDMAAKHIDSSQYIRKLLGLTPDRHVTGVFNRKTDGGRHTSPRFSLMVQNDTTRSTGPITIGGVPYADEKAQAVDFSLDFLKKYSGVKSDLQPFMDAQGEVHYGDTETAAANGWMPMDVWNTIEDNKRQDRTQKANEAYHKGMLGIYQGRNDAKTSGSANPIKEFGSRVAIMQHYNQILAGITDPASFKDTIQAINNDLSRLGVEGVFQETRAPQSIRDADGNIQTVMTPGIKLISFKDTASSPAQSTPSPQAIQFLNANRNNPAVLRDFQAKYGVDPQRYLAGQQSTPGMMDPRQYLGLTQR